MSFTMIIRPSAEQDIADGCNYYELEEAGLGEEFLDVVADALRHVRESPRLYAPEFKSVRRAPTSRFSYVLYYRIEGDVIDVLAVQHAKRSARHWRSRA